MTPSSASSGLAPAALPRSIDLTYPSNRWAVAGLLGGVVLSRLRGRSWVGSVGTGLGGFAAWAIARELDPDHTQSANVALPLALATSLLSDDQSDAAALGDVLAAFTALSSTRVLSATVGQAASASDQAALGAAAAMCTGAGQRAAALLPGAALTLSSRQADDLAPRNDWSGPAALLAAVLPTVGSTRAASRQPLSSAAIAGALLLAPQLLQPEPVSTETDQGDRTISSERVAQSRQMALGGLALAAVLGGTRSALPLAVATLSTGLRRRLAR